MASCSCQKGSRQHATGSAARPAPAAAAAAEQKSKADGSRCQLSDCQAVRLCQTLAKSELYISCYLPLSICLSLFGYAVGLASNLTTL